MNDDEHTSMDERVERKGLDRTMTVVGRNNDRRTNVRWNGIDHWTKQLNKTERTTTTTNCDAMVNNVADNVMIYVTVDNTTDDITTNVSLQTRCCRSLRSFASMAGCDATDACYNLWCYILPRSFAAMVGGNAMNITSQITRKFYNDVMLKQFYFTF